MKRLLACSVVILLALSAVMGFLPLAGAQTTRVGAYVDQITWFQQTNQAQALLDLQSGAMDIYEFQLRTVTDIRSAKQNPNLNTVDTAGSLNNLFLNPVPTNQSVAPGKINPMSAREVREAMNYLIDRKFIVDQIFGGAGSTHTTLWWTQHPEYGREPVFFATEERKYPYNPTLARALISTGMAKLGASFVNGKWTYGGNPINLNLVQRTEDLRFEIGSYVANQLRSAGFDVTLVPRSGGGAFGIVYNGPPDGDAWHVYTEGWAVTALVAWDDGTPYFYFNTGEGSRIWSFYNPATFPDDSLEKRMADVSQRLFESNYTSLAERQQLIKDAVDLTLKNSVRVWLYAGATFASSKRVENDGAGPGVGYVYDLAAGPWALYSTRTARFAGVTGGNLKVGQRLMFVAPWNPWRGFGWLYDGLQLFALHDPAIWVDPHSGLNVPIRTDFQVTTAGPTGKLSVPSDAVLWNNTASAFTPTKYTQATSKVKLNFTFSKWHSGQDASMNDVLHEIALWGRFARGGDIYAIDNDAQNIAMILFNQLARGIKVLNARELEVYADFWHVDPTTIAVTLAGVTCGGSGCSGVFPVVPWEVAQLAMAPVLAGVALISPDNAEALGKLALDISKGASLNNATCGFTSGTTGCLDRALTVYKGANRRPVGSQNTNPGGLYYVSDAEATARWTALDAWRQARNHYFVSNGPFYLDTVNLADPSNPQTIMKRVHAGDPNVAYDYPYLADRWDNFLVPKLPAVQVGTVPRIVPGIASNISVTTSLSGQAYDRLTMIWQVFSPLTGAFIIGGNGLNVGPGKWNVSLTGDLTAKLGEGAYTLQLITIGDEAAVPVVSTASMVAVHPLTILEEELATETAALRGELTNLQTRLDQARADAAASQNVLLAALGAAIAVAAISLGLNVLNMRTLNRMRAPATGPEAKSLQFEQRKP